MKAEESLWGVTRLALRRVALVLAIWIALIVIGAELDSAGIGILRHCRITEGYADMIRGVCRP